MEEEEDEADLYDHKYEQIDCFQGTMRVLNIYYQMLTEKLKIVCKVGNTVKSEKSYCI